jgi:molybdopterin synthase sulfur carrier subunit
LGKLVGYFGEFYPVFLSFGWFMNTVKVRFFASLRERYGISEQEIALEAPIPVSEVWKRVVAEPIPARVLAAINHEYVALDGLVRAGDELAFFPPVTGG